MNHDAIVNFDAIVNLDNVVNDAFSGKQLCSICNVVKLCICCPYCSYLSCASCTKKYILTTIYSAHCMSCRKLWSDSFLEQSFSKHFLSTDYRDKIKNVLWEKEKSYLPNTQVILMYTIQEEQIDTSLSLLYKELKQIQQLIHQLKSKRQDLQKKRCQPINFNIISCPIPTCKGIVRDQICQLCTISVCEICNDQKETDHHCNPEQLQSIQFIKETSKSCPNCNVFIHRTSGCDHMWCTSCHTPFRWSTLEIEKRVLPNPHYYEYMSTLSSSLCIESLMLEQRHKVIIEQRIQELQVSDYIKDQLHIKLNKIIHIREVELPTIVIENEYTNQDVRIKYLRNELSEEECKSLVYSRHKKHDHSQKYRDILLLYISIVSEWFIQLPLQIIEQEEHLRHYVNTEIQKLNTYHNVTYHLL